MSVTNGQTADQTTFNNAYMSRTATTTSTTAIVQLNNTQPASGSSVSNAQEAINETFDAVGMTGVNDTTRKNYSDNTVVANGDSHKTAIGKLSAAFNPTGSPSCVTSIVDSSNDTVQGKLSVYGDSMVYATIDPINKKLNIGWLAAPIVYFKNVTLPNNTSSATVLAASTIALNGGFTFWFCLTRGSGNRQVGSIRVTTDGTNSQMSPDYDEWGTPGVTWSTTVETVGGQTSVTLKYVTTNTGVDAKIDYEQKSFALPT